jgi:NDP-sugar pyrophosphorylase family protein
MHYGIIAAGEGSRLVQEGVQRPKPLVELCSEPMIGRLAGIFMRCGAESVNVIVNEQMTEVAAYLKELKKTFPVELNIVVKSTPSSMHSFYELSRLLKGKGRFILTTVDTIFREEDFRPYVEAFASAPYSVDGMMAVTSFIDDEKPLYVETLDDMKITSFRDAPWDGVKYISGGIYGLDNKAVAVLEDCIARGVSRMRNFQRALVESGLNLKAFNLGKIVDVDHAADIATAESFILGK